MRSLIVTIFVISCAYVGIKMVEGFTDVVESHTQRIERVSGY